MQYYASHIFHYLSTAAAMAERNKAQSSLRHGYTAGGHTITLIKASRLVETC